MGKPTFLRLKGKIVEHGYTTKTFASALGICIDSAYRKLRGEMDFTLYEIFVMLNIFDCDFEEIFTEEDFHKSKKYRKTHVKSEF